MTLLRRILPAPLLSASLLTLWLVLARSAGPGQVLLALLIAIVIPLLTSRLRLTMVRIRRPGAIVRFFLVVCRDVVASNVEVALDVIRWRWQRPSPQFVVIPLELRDPMGLAALSMVTTIVPGTVWSELAVDGSALRLHVWNVRDEGAFVTRFKARYEQPLREIFE